MKVSITSRKWIGGLAIIIVLLGWQLSATLIRLPLILPAPQEAVSQIMALIVTGDFWRHLGATLNRGLAGFGLSLAVGIAIGICAGRNVFLEAFFRPWIILVRSTPVMSVIILALIWFKRETVPVFVTFLMAFPIVVQNIIEGMKSIDGDLLAMADTYRITSWRRFVYLYLPSLGPFLAAGISGGLGITWKVLIAAEVLSYPTWGIGAQMDTARVYLQTDKVFAWTMVVVMLGLFFDYLLDSLIKRPFKSWKAAAHD
jgi:NitT/TauT family transport system permease protein